MRLKFVTLLIACLLAAAMPAARSQNMPPLRQPRQDTGCDERNFLGGYYIEDNRKVFDDERYAAFALRLNTPVYRDSSGDARAARALRFDERVRISDPGEGTDRLKVSDTSAQPIGWVAKSTVLCRVYPLADPDRPGWHGRLLIWSGTRKLYQTPDVLAEEERCEGPCAQAGEHQTYFIYAEENDHYLISQNAHLANNSSQLAGWLRKGDGQIWNTGIGLRPREELADVPLGTPEKFACAYASMQDLESGKDCHPILGGRRWLGLNERMPILQETASAYRILLRDPGPSPSDVARGVSVDGIGAAFVPADDKVILELLLSRDHLVAWLNFLGMLKNLPPDESRRMWRLMRSPTMGDDFYRHDDDQNQISLQQTPMKPLNSAHSKLLQYSADELADPSKVPDCEIDRIRQYFAAKYEILIIVFGSNGRAKPVFTETTWPESQCPNVSDKGKKLTFVGAVTAQVLNLPGSTTDYSMMHRRGNESFFWVPLDYLP